MTGHATEVAKGERFEFGASWAQLLNVLNDGLIALAQQSLRNMLGVMVTCGGGLGCNEFVFTCASNP